MNNHLKQGKSLNWLLGGLTNLLSSEDFLQSSKDGFLNIMGEHFEKNVKPSEMVFDQLEALIESNPQFIINEVRKFLESHYSITKLIGIAVNRKVGQVIRLKMRLVEISDIYESASAFQMLAFLISKQRALYDNLVEAKTVFGQFRTLGLSKQEVDLLRLIRNANSHKFKIGNSCLIDSEGNEILIKDIENIHTKMESILNWWIAFIFFSMWYLPNFGILILISILSSFKHNDDAWKSLTEGIVLLYGDINQEISSEKLNAQSEQGQSNSHHYYNNLSRDFKKNKILKRNYDRSVDKLLWSNMVLILSKLEYRLVEMQSQIENIKGKLTNEPDVATIVYITEGLNKYTKKIIEFRESLASNPDSISNILSRRQKMAIFRHK